MSKDIIQNFLIFQLEYKATIKSKKRLCKQFGSIDMI